MKAYYQADGVTIYHGDCFELLEELDGIGAVITDPPYSSGGNFRGDRVRSTVEKYVQTGTLIYRPEFAGDSRDQRAFLIWSTMWMTLAKRASLVGAPIACFTDWRQLPVTTDALQVAGWSWRGVATWAKGFGRPSPAGFSNSCEFVAWGSNGPATERDSYPPGYYETPSLRDTQKEHIAQKPIDVMRWICRIAPPGAVVLDPFMGVGSTLRAAKDLGLPAIGCELDERYCEAAAERLSQQSLNFEVPAPQEALPLLLSDPTQ